MVQVAVNIIYNSDITWMCCTVNAVTTPLLLNSTFEVRAKSDEPASHLHLVILQMILSKVKSKHTWSYLGFSVWSDDKWTGGAGDRTTYKAEIHLLSRCMYQRKLNNLLKTICFKSWFTAKPTLHGNDFVHRRWCVCVIASDNLRITAGLMWLREY